MYQRFLAKHGVFFLLQKPGKVLYMTGAAPIFRHNKGLGVGVVDVSALHKQPW